MPTAIIIKCAAWADQRRCRVLQILLEVGFDAFPSSSLFERELIVCLFRRCERKTHPGASLVQRDLARPNYEEEPTSKGLQIGCVLEKERDMYAFRYLDI